MDQTKNSEDAFKLGTWLGRQQALGLIAKRCTVAEIECLIETYEDKLYLALEPTWEEYCKNRLGISRRTAERLIRTYRRQGPRLAKLNCFVRIRPTEYEIYDAVLTDEGLLHGGEIIAIEPENTPRLAQAVEAIRQESASDSEPLDPAARSFTKAEKLLNAAVSEFARLQTM